MDHGTNVFTLLPTKGVTLRQIKSFCIMVTIEYFGHVIRQEDFENGSHTMHPMNILNKTGNVTEFKSLLGLCNFTKLIVQRFERCSLYLSIEVERITV